MSLTRDEFAALALSCLEDLTAYVRRLARDPADADDLIQATFERAFRAWRGLREARACRAWLFRIARNLWLDSRRTIRSRPELRLVDLEDAAPALLMPADAVARLDARDIEGALARLPEDQVEAVLLCDLWGFQYEEIAELTGVPIGTVRSRIARGRARLARLLSESMGRSVKGSLP